MTDKKFLIALVIFSFLFANSAKAAILPSGDIIVPDSPFYFLQTWKESIQTFFTFGAENKARQYLHLADVRLNEYQKMLEKGKTEIAEKTLDKYENQLNRALEKAEELKNKGKDVTDLSEKIEQTVSKHLEVLQENLQKVPEQAKKGLEKAINNSQKGWQRTLEKIGGQKDEHGCLIPAGYIWCGAKQKCLRSWEEKCEKAAQACKNLCGDGTCQEVVCMAIGCLCPETKESCPQDCGIKEKTRRESLPGACQNQCGNGVCQQVVCMGTNCPCPETKENCPQDCAKNELKKSKKPESICKDLCGDGVCQEVSCLGSSCPCPENQATCPQDCTGKKEKKEQPIEKPLLNPHILDH